MNGEVMLSFGLGATVDTIVSYRGIPVSDRHIEVTFIGKLVSRTV